MKSTNLLYESEPFSKESNFLIIILEINFIIFLSCAYSIAILLFLSLRVTSALYNNRETIRLLFFLQAICKALPIGPI